MFGGLPPAGQAGWPDGSIPLATVRPPLQAHSCPLERGRWATALGRVGSLLSTAGPGASSRVPAPSGGDKEVKILTPEHTQRSDPLFQILQRKWRIKAGMRVWSPWARHPAVGDYGHWHQHPSERNQGPGHASILGDRKAHGSRSCGHRKGGDSGGGCGSGGHEEVLHGPQGQDGAWPSRGGRTRPVALSSDALSEFTALLRLTPAHAAHFTEGEDEVYLGTADLNPKLWKLPL